MVSRPFITPRDVKEYTEYPKVCNRLDNKILVDISRAESYIARYTNNTFEKYLEVPESVKTATLIIAEAYSYNACLVADDKKSETFDDYSYTTERNYIDISSLDIHMLLEKFVMKKSNIDMKLRKL